MLTREEHLDFCKICKKRKFDMKKGLVCSLTNEWADFDNNCTDFEEDEQAKFRENRERDRKKKDSIAMMTGGLSSIGIKNGLVAGCIYFGVGFGWLLLTVFYIQRVFFYSSLPMIIGIVLIIKNLINQNQKRKKRQYQKVKEEMIDHF